MVSAHRGRGCGLADPQGEHAALTVLGAALRRGGQPSQALVVFQEASGLATENSFVYYASDALVEMTEAHLTLGDLDAAIDQGTAAVELARRIGYRENLALALDALGRAHFASGGIARARELWRDAITIFTELGHQDEASALATRLNSREST